jgi:hypothetical protein
VTTLFRAARAMRPPRPMDYLPAVCTCCSRPIERGEVFTLAEWRMVTRLRAPNA